MTTENLTIEDAKKMKIFSATESQMDKAVEVLNKYLSSNPGVGVDKEHPAMHGVEISNAHDYIKESFDNYLVQVIEEVEEHKHEDMVVILGLFVGFMEGMPEIIKSKGFELETIFKNACK